jgi:16S rRNA (cytosine1402-N4)-methyltransferase
MSIHRPVLLREVIEGLNLKPGSVVVDATLGGGGHSIAILEKIGKKGKLIAIDWDEHAIEKFKSKVKSQKAKVRTWKPEAGNSRLASTSSLRESRRVLAIKDNFANLKNILGGLGVETVDAVLADLGYSSDQIADPERGISFQKDAPLDMRLGRSLRITNSYESTNDLTAKKIVNNYSEKELARILKEYGEEKFARNIARKIIAYRKNNKIETTLELVKIISSAVPEKYKNRKIHCATKTFQALRIEVNRELENLEKFIPQAISVLAKGGRLGIITFHSLEDRIVKNLFRENARGCICPPSFPKCVCGREAKVYPVKSSEAGAAKPQFNRVKIITGKPIVPGEREIEKNPRARSAKLRICEKI